ncbi:ferritin-like domain-containing protein [Pedobacter gandavensis]|uniref:ferritin-like domain-containing protein n=1 Tax=Pedobacter gandavensis TaxID=2679963 RepID=UPI00292E3D32|nr:ferritin-like domain-containing protein [Pedobacter gandavensis]
MNKLTSASTGTIHRRKLFQYAGTALLAVAAVGCKENNPVPSTPYINKDFTIDFKDDNGLLNYLYTLAQLEAEFYTRAVANLAPGFTSVQALFVTDIKGHKITHAEFFKTFLGPAAVGTLEFEFAGLDFSNATSVFGMAKTIENLGLAAYNGAIAKSKEGYTLILLSQIASVEARHAAWISSQLPDQAFADLAALEALGAMAKDGLDVALSPVQVLAQAKKYITTSLNVINL